MALGQEGENEALDSVEREAKRLRASTEASAGPGDALFQREVDLPCAQDAAARAAPRVYAAMPVETPVESGLEQMQALADLLQEESSDEAQEPSMAESGLAKLAELPSPTCEEPPANPSDYLPKEPPRESFYSLQDVMEDVPEDVGGEPTAELQSSLSEDQQMQSEASPEYSPVDAPDEAGGERLDEVQSANSEDTDTPSGDDCEVSPDYSPVDSQEDDLEEASGEPPERLQSMNSEGGEKQSGGGSDISPDYSPVDTQEDVPEEACGEPPERLQSVTSEGSQKQSGDGCDISPDYSPVDVPEEACGEPPEKLRSNNSEVTGKQSRDGCNVSPDCSAVVAASSEADLHVAPMAGGESTRAEQQPTPGPSANTKNDPEGHADVQPKMVNGCNSGGSVQETKRKGISIKVKEEPHDGPPHLPAPARPGTARITGGSNFRCERGLPGAIAGTCLGGPSLGLWRDDAPGRRAELISFGPSHVGRVYCGRCWEEFEAAAATGDAPTSEQQPVRLPPAPGRDGCQHWPAQACRGKPQDALWADEEGGGVFCDSCWKDFEKAGLVVGGTELEEPPEASGWILRESRSHPGLRYWFHAGLGKSQWTKPT